MYARLSFSLSFDVEVEFILNHTRHVHDMDVVIGHLEAFRSPVFEMPIALFLLSHLNQHIT